MATPCRYKKQGTQFFKVDEEHGIAFGWAIIATERGVPYFDTQGDHIPMDAVAKAAARYVPRETYHTPEQFSRMLDCVVAPAHPKAKPSTVANITERRARRTIYVLL